METVGLGSQEVRLIQNSFATLLDSPSISCTILDAQTQRYLAMSKGVLLSLGMEAKEDFVSHTADEMLGPLFSKNRLNHKSFKQGRQIHHRIQRQKQPLQNTFFVMVPNGLIRVFRFHQVPVLDGFKQVSLIVTHAEDLTEQYDYLSLFKLYQLNHKRVEDAIHYFLTYLGIRDYFSELPSLQELYTLLFTSTQEQSAFIQHRFHLECHSIHLNLERLTDKFHHGSLEELLHGLMHSQGIYNVSMR